MKRFALVIGNQTYERARKLGTPIDDSIEVATILDSIGFEVSHAVDCDKTEIRRKLKAFNEKIRDAEADVALLYYSGHAFQLHDENWILATDSDIQTADEIEAEATRLARQLQTMREAADISLVFLDACRDNPFPDADAQAQDRISGPVPVQKGTYGTALIAFSAEKGQIADDGDSLSPFTSAFVEHVGTPGLEIGKLMENIQASVKAATRGRQSPRWDDGLIGDFFFVPSEAGDEKLGPATANDLVVLFGGEQAESRDFMAFEALGAALQPVPAETMAVVQPWLAGDPLPAWSSKLETKLLRAKRPLLIDYCGKAKGAADDARLKIFLYDVASVQPARLKNDFYVKSDRMLENAKSGDRLIWKPVGATPEERVLNGLNAEDVGIFAPFVLRKLGVEIQNGEPLPYVAADLVPMLGTALIKNLGIIVGGKDEPPWSTAVKPISFKRDAGAEDKLQNAVANSFPPGRANVVAACEESRGNAMLDSFLGGISSRILEGQRLAMQRIRERLCIVRFVARVDPKDERDAIPVADDLWFVLKFEKSDNATYKLGNCKEARDWFKDVAKVHGIAIDDARAA
ncbi:MAG: hypothetical protein EOS07_07445 [Mesorhizobium sp.]|uniref:caspase family protein n=1 Tax=Mesorhizobium sp. TaxID=1871066 RepID=UPI000FE2B278|nr:caspase family protein [Mesorhizobium sp.]RWO10984.1 MAG: hypothetical protein EOS07_07445 [Mesorhizobium sp.]RWP07900.1 MAG: hypothetical protein EOQ99_04055 [Mesorhizobium sp.]RWQ22705.1 MAG: hypothetical protein EOR92_06730 [Mesorhizobium sp.]RWQ55236.1 MAG: hypothetical protein EOS84_11795 [Mesorhizobium sp.]RWQ61578.1 MAG: hypothetical protein EOS83_00415 [Mesorhizobium sp.]